MSKTIPPLDLGWLLMESPGGTTHVGAMLLFQKTSRAGAPVREIVESYRRCRPLPPFNYLPQLLGVGAPHFREVDTWDSHYHVQHLALPSGSSYDDLLRLVADLHEPMLDRHRPLFRCWVIDGVPGNRFAIYTKTHHSIIDGVSGLKKLYEGLSTSTERTIPTPAFALPTPEPQPAPPHPGLHRLLDTIHSAVVQVGTVNQISLSAARKAVSAALGSHVEGSLPFVAPHAPTNAPAQQARGFATLSVPLAEMHRIARQHHATLNDVAAAIIDHGLHAYLRQAGQAYAHELVAMCPVSLRDDSDSAVGTRVSALFVRLGRPEATMTDRLREVVHSVASAKDELGAMSTNAAMTFAVALVALAGAGASTHLDRVGHPACNLVISNIPGNTEPHYLNGAPLIGIFPVSALAASIGLNVTLSSYCDTMNFGFVTNTAAISDVQALAEFTGKAYAELTAESARA